jgi:hypothetical protein
VAPYGRPAVSHRSPELWTADFTSHAECRALGTRITWLSNVRSRREEYRCYKTTYRYHYRRWTSTFTICLRGENETQPDEVTSVAA